MNFNIVKGVLNVSRNDLNLKACLKGGMSFRWTQLEKNSNKIEFIGVLKNKIYILNQSENKNHIEYSVYYKSNDLEQNENLKIKINEELNDYFRLNENLKNLYDEWSKRDLKFNERVKTYSEILNGIRVLRIDPVENIFSFICSSNNNIKRITQMVSNMSIHFGKLIGTLEGIDHFEFPTIDRLAQKDVEEKLRTLKFGYRAKFISQAAIYLKENYPNHDEWLYSLREQPYNLVHQNLLKIPGVGKKVADCISLMSMDKLEAIPVDTHVLSLAKNMYNFFGNHDESKSKKKSNNLTDKSYWEIGEKFRNLWGKYAGWAQTIMFIDDLKSFKKEKSDSLIKNENSFKKESNDLASSSNEILNIKTEDIDLSELFVDKNIIKKEPVNYSVDSSTLDSKKIKFKSNKAIQKELDSKSTNLKRSNYCMTNSPSQKISIKKKKS